MIKILCFLIFASSILYSTTKCVEFIERPSNITVTEVHYDPQLNDIVLRIRANIFIFNVDQYYGIKVKNKIGAKQKVDDVVGENPVIVELH